jgi:lysine/ornithine N-monooxygenase
MKITYKIWAFLKTTHCSVDDDYYKSYSYETFYNFPIKSFDLTEEEFTYFQIGISSSGISSNYTFLYQKLIDGLPSDHDMMSKILTEGKNIKEQQEKEKEVREKKNKELAEKRKKKKEAKEKKLLEELKEKYEESKKREKYV